MPACLWKDIPPISNILASLMPALIHSKPFHRKVPKMAFGLATNLFHLCRIS